MAVLKCKMCGGDLNIKEGSTVAECMYCGTKQTVPKLDSEKKATLFSRANRLRFNCEFDKASGLYESIVAEFPEEAEAFWGLVLCKYGIEYVDDPATAKKIPTCHRSSFESVLEDSDFEQTLENADPAARAVYREEAKSIEELRQNIVEVSAKEEPYDIFICYKETDLNGERTIDSVIAQDVYTALTEKGYRVFFSRISLEDKLGREYEPYIFAALNSAKIMLAFGTDYEYYNAVWVKNEWSRYLKLMATDRTKTLIPCYKGIDAYDMPKEFLRLQSQDMGKVGAMQDLLRGIEKILPKKPVEIRTEVKETKEVKTVEKVVEKVVVKGAEGGADTGSLLRRAEMFLEDGDFNSANTYAEKVLDILPECAEAYLVKLCCDLKLNSKKQLNGLKEPFNSNNNYNKILRFANDDLKEEVNGYLNAIQERIDAERKAAEEKKRADEEARRIAEQKRVAEELAAEERMKAAQKVVEERRLAELKRIEAIRKKYALASKLLDGGVLTLGGTFAPRRDIKKDKDKTSEWSDIVAFSAGHEFKVGLKADGTVIAVGKNKEGQCNVSDWRDIVAISAGYSYTVGLKADGTVVATGLMSRYIAGWRDIVAISAGLFHTVGLKKDGTVVASGLNKEGECNVTEWKDIVAISAGFSYTVGLKSDGTVVTVGKDAKILGWQDIIAISVGDYNTVGLKSDGTVVTVGRCGQVNYSEWHDVVAIRAADFCVLGLKSDGTLLPDTYHNLFDLPNGRLFNSIDTLEEELKQAHKERKRALLKEKESLQNELASLKGIFAGKRRKEIEERLSEIDSLVASYDKEIN